MIARLVALALVLAAGCVRVVDLTPDIDAGSLPDAAPFPDAGGLPDADVTLPVDAPGNLDALAVDA